MRSCRLPCRTYCTALLHASARASSHAANSASINPRARRNVRTASRVARTSLSSHPSERRSVEPGDVCPVRADIGSAFHDFKISMEPCEFQNLLDRRWRVEQADGHVAIVRAIGSPFVHGNERAKAATDRKSKRLNS